MSLNTGAFGEGFPYSNFHDLNMDWIIKIAKDFLDQYTHIQEIIETGKEDIQTLTESGIEQIGDLTATSLQDLQDKADALETLLQQWYDTHSEDIAQQLADALSDLNAWYNTHSEDISNQLATAISNFNNAASNKAAETIATIPDDYSALSAKANALVNTVFAFLGEYAYTMIRGIVSPSTGNTGETGTSTTGMRTNSKISIKLGDVITFDATKTVSIYKYNPSDNSYIGYEDISTPYVFTADFYGYITCLFEDSSVPNSSVNIEYFKLKKYNAVEYIQKLEDSIATRTILYPLNTGRLNNQGVLLMTRTYAKTSQFAYILRGSHLETVDNTVTIRIVKYSDLDIENPSSVFSWMKAGQTDYTFTESGWYRVDVEYVDTTTLADDTIFDKITGHIYTINDNAGIREIATESDLHVAVANSSLTKIILKSDITLTTQLSIVRNNLTIEGNGHKISCDGSLTYLLYVTGDSIYLNNLILSDALDDVLYIGGYGSVYVNNCDISKSSQNDGIGLHSSVHAYIKNCTLHDNYDEGISTHDTSWACVDSCVAYKNGYVLNTNTGNPNSLGGIHLGGSLMGTVINCETHDNYYSGISFTTLDSPWDSTSISICKNNHSHNNGHAGIMFGGATHIECCGNMTWENLYGILFYKKSEHQNNGYIGINTVFEGNYTIWSDADGGLHFKP